MRELSYNEAAVEAVAEEMRRDPKIFYMSTDPIGPLLKEFGDQRIRSTPIAEAALTGMAIGAAGSGFPFPQTTITGRVYAPATPRL